MKNGRIFLLLLATLAGFVLVLGRLFQIQVVNAAEHRGRSELQANGIADIERERGTIYDRRHRELAVSLRVKSLAADPRKFPTPAVRRDVAERIAPLLGMEPEAVADKLARSGEFAWIARKIADTAAQSIASMKIKGLFFETEFRRHYPHGRLAAHALGIVGLDDKGLEGIERAYDSYLSGPELTVPFTRDATGNPIPVNGRIEYPRFDGHSLELTIDLTIQASLEQALARQVEAFSAKSASAVIMDPVTGEILAMANVPTFDPNDVRASTEEERKNRAIADAFEPGSAFKVFSGALALASSKVDPADKFVCNGHMSIYGVKIRCHKTHGPVDYRRGIELSCNIPAMSVAQKLSGSEIYRGLGSFGFGKKTGIGLSGEATGMLRPVKDWSGLSPAMLGIGQEVSVTTLQLAAAAAAIANQGRLMAPRIVRSIRRGKEGTLKNFSPEVRAQVCDPRTARTMASIMEGVVGRGTGQQAAIGFFPVAGKTGTAQVAGPTGGYLDGKYNAVFIGWTPVEAPLMVMAVVIHEPDASKGYYGGAVAAPVFQWVGTDAMAYMRVVPQQKLAAKKKLEIAAPRRPVKLAPGGVKNGKVVVPDLRNMTMREVNEVMATLPIDFTPVGTGISFQQEPPPGREIPIESAVRVEFRPPGGMETLADIAP